jgi:hypothetical protein
MVQPLVLKVWTRSIKNTWKLVEKADSWAPCQTFYIGIYSLTRSSGDSEPQSSLRFILTVRVSPLHATGGETEAQSE